MVKTESYLVINKNGVKTVKRKKPDLGWDEICCKLVIDVPPELFERPHLEAKLIIKDIPNNANIPEVIINTKELIEQQTGAKIDFRVVKEKWDEKSDGYRAIEEDKK